MNTKQIQGNLAFKIAVMCVFFFKVNGLDVTYIIDMHSVRSLKCCNMDNLDELKPKTSASLPVTSSFENPSALFNSATQNAVVFFVRVQ